MIIDRIENSHLYHTLHPGFKRAFDHIHHIDVDSVPVGKQEIDGEKMYVLVQEYNTKPFEQGVWEAHRRYIDLQYVVQGAEGIGYANINHLGQGNYDPNKDFLPLHGAGDLVTLRSGCFMILMPEDAHMPGIAIATPAPVRKIVIKISIDQDETRPPA
jgi:YhcH/YjgK/YiaL family protein